MSDGNGESWPVGYQFALALVGMIFVGFLWVGLPILSTLKFGQGVAVAELGLWAPMIATMLALTTMTISAIFLFMTFRIDRGTRLKAEETVKSFISDLEPDILEAATNARTSADNARASADNAAQEAKTAADAAITASSQCANEFQNQLEAEVNERCQVQKVEQLIADALQKHVSEESLPKGVDQLLKGKLDEAAALELIGRVLAKWIENLPAQERKKLVRALLDMLKRLKRRSSWLAKLFSKFRKQD